MRIYEFAKQSNVTSKQLIDFLKKEGFAVGNHMSVLSEQEIAVLQKYVSQLSSVDSQQSAGNQQEALLKAEPLKNENPPLKEDISSSKKIITPRQEGLSIEKESIVQKTVSASPQSNTAVVTPKDVMILEAMSLMALAQKINKPVSEIILQLLKMGIVTTKNQIISEDVIAKITTHFGIETAKNSVKKAASKEGATKSIPEDVVGMVHERMPVIVVLGHVDHGKTTLLDYIRKTRVAHREKGGITQHIGAYQATTSQGDIVFIDTPGHEAFGKIRQRGIRVADIAVIVVAADDGIMPQTVEAIKQALSMNVVIIVAINKVDKVDSARIDIVKRQLTQYGLVSEDWGGDIVCISISAKTGKGVDQLLEMIALQAQMMELKTNPAVEGRGYVLESKLERGRGVVGTLISQHGSVAIGDYFICGSTTGRISSLVDSYGVSKEKVGPSVPVQVGGFDSLAQVGDFFKIVSREEYRKAKGQEPIVKNSSAVRNTVMQAGTLNLVIKTDTDSSKEALLEAIEGLSKKSDSGINVVYAGIGTINESDVELAFNINAHIVALHTKAQPAVVALAQQRKVSILQFDIIYKLLEYLQERTAVQKVIPMIRKKIGQATVLRVFDIKGIGVIAGSIVNDGRFVKDGEVIAYRGGRKVGNGVIKSLQREKRTVKEVHAGFECGFIVDGFSDWMVDDVVECYSLETDSKK